MTDVPSQRRVRRLQVLGAVAGALTVLAVLVSLGGQDSPQSGERIGVPVLPDFATVRAEASEIRVTLADESYSLVNGPDGWTLGGTDGYPIRADRLADLASGLETLTWGEGRTRDPGKMNRIGLGEPRDGGTGALIEIVNEAGTVTASLLTGRKGPNVYARLPGEAQAFRSRPDRSHLVGRDAGFDHSDRSVDPFAGLHVGIVLRRGRTAHVEGPVIAGAISLIGLQNVKEGLIAGADQTVGEVVRMRVAALAGNGVDRFDVVGPHLVEHLV